MAAEATAAYPIPMPENCTVYGAGADPSSSIGVA